MTSRQPHIWLQVFSQQPNNPLEAHGDKRHAARFKCEAVKQVTQRGHQCPRWLETVLRRQVKRCVRCYKKRYLQGTSLGNKAVRGTENSKQVR